MATVTVRSNEGEWEDDLHRLFFCQYCRFLFHMGHLLNTALGGAIYRIYTALGYNVVGINHLGDWGTQFGKLIVAHKLWGNKNEIDERGVRALVEIYVKFHKEEEKIRLWETRQELGSRQSRTAIQKHLNCLNISKRLLSKEVNRIYERLHIKFDSYAGESFTTTRCNLCWTN